MRKEKTLIAMLRQLADLLAEECKRNSEFAAKLEAVLAPLPKQSVAAPNTPRTRQVGVLPDLHAEWTARGETDFRLWLRELSVPTIRATIRAEDLDPARRTAKWKEAEKLADFVADGLKARLARGSSFLSNTNGSRSKE